MCTATWIYTRDSYELFFNRDELFTRTGAIPPKIQNIDDMRYIAPTDPDGGGTWIGTNATGLTAALLNFYPDVDSRVRSSLIEPRPDLVSRGEIVRNAMAHRTIEEIVSMLESYVLSRFNPFTLLCITPASGPVLMRWFKEFSIDTSPSMPASSSSFRTKPVIENRVSAFDAINNRIGDQIRLDERSALHAEYHRSHSPERGPFSVCMHRVDAQTQSYTHVSVDVDQIRYSYVPGSPCVTEPLPELSIIR